MPDRFRRLFEGPDEIEQFPDPFGRIGQGATEIRDPTSAPEGQRLFDDFRSAFNEGRPLPELFGPTDTLEIKAGIGPGRQNRRPDVAKVETFMDALGAHDPSPTDGPTGLLNLQLEEDLQRFQAKNGLTVDGIVDPGGETLRQIQGELTRTLGPDALTPRARLGDTGSGLGAPADNPLAGIDLPRDPGANLIPIQSTTGLPGGGRGERSGAGGPLTREEFLKISRESERRFNEELDRIEKRMKAIENEGIKTGLLIAARALRHFRKGSGKTMNIKRNWLRGFNAVRMGERKGPAAFRELDNRKETSKRGGISRTNHWRAREIKGRPDFGPALRMGSARHRTVVETKTFRLGRGNWNQPNSVERLVPTGSERQQDSRSG